MTPLQQAAKAIEADMREPGFGITLIVEGDPDAFFERLARAALLAIRQPSEAMVFAGASADHGPAHIPVEWIGSAWAAMVDAALERSPADTPTAL
jgi:hypothetical protein